MKFCKLSIRQLQIYKCECLQDTIDGNAEPQPCFLVFLIIILIISCFVLVLRLHEVDYRHNQSGNEVVRRYAWWLQIVGVLLTFGLVAAMGVLLVWARMDEC